jgi:DNA replication and repair protein RecF
MQGHPVRDFGSQGQCRSTALAMKFAAAEIIENYSNAKPLLLLDDVFDKLDQNRIEQLIGLVASNHFGQVFITDTHKERTVGLFEGKNIDYLLVEV